ncbi:MAG: RHS repeat-associated core domain-containing protein [Reichenbachiella sp.]|uniref:RHS repeat protein n=1 Tax=Reichenbachiella sp. TaxID=2184521 RepID=UPI002966307E|nr:RHS repeat-associated core domain-containing protein [Reichenbachiella sp.]MDW3210924.1 RHS repeat-associated core domain-containing protein [Reichenbachiella sp.]
MACFSSFAQGPAPDPDPGGGSGGGSGGGGGTSGTPARPNTSFTTTYNCGSTKVKRNSNAPAGTVWYWQSSSSGTSKSYQSNTYTFSSSRNVYLRSYNPYNGAWGSALSAGYKSVNPNNLNAGNTSGAKTICYGASAGTLGNSSSASGGLSSYSYQWQVSSNNSSWSNISGATGTSYSPGNLTATRYYRRRVTSCGYTKYAASEKITVRGNLSAGSIGNAQTVCYNGNPSALSNTASASGGATRTYQWQKSTSSSSSGFSNISGATGSTYDPPALTQSTWYRRRVTSSSGCGTKYTNVIKVTVRSNLSAGSIGNAQTLCYNNDASTLTNTASASGGATRTYQWQQSTTSSSSGFSNISGATSSTYNPPALTQTTWYRRRVTSSSGCGTKYTNVIQLTVYGNLNAGSIDQAQTLCYGNDPVAFSNTSSATGGTGLSYVWQKSTTSASSGYSNIAGATNSTYDPPALFQSTWYRRGVTSGSGCGTKYTAAIKVTIHDELLSGSIGNGQTICYNTDAAALSNEVSASGGDSRAYQWQLSATGASSGFSDIVGATASTYDPAALTQTTWFRRNVISCGSTLSSNVIAVNVYEPMTSGTIAGPSSLCYIETGEITATSPTGADGNYGYQWQTSTDQSNWSDIAGATSNALALADSSQSAYYRRQASTSCNSLLSNEIFVEVKSAIDPGSIGSDLVICEEYVADPIVGSDLSSYGATYQWQESADGNVWTDISSATSQNYVPQAHNSYYRRAVTIEGCTVFSDTKQIEAIACVAVAGDDQVTTSDDQPMALSGSPAGGSWSGVGVVEDTFDPRVAGEGLHELTYAYTTAPGGTTEDKLLVNVSFASIAPEELAKHIFQYKYDQRHRLIAKLVPGSGWEYIVYDARDRVVLTQTPNQRMEDKWSFVKYDQFNRPVITGEKVITGDVESIRAAVASSDGVESFDTNGLVQYTNTAYPVGITIDEILSVTYYDDYDFTSEEFQLPLNVFDNTENKLIPAQSTFGVKGLTTGSMAKISGTTDQFVRTVNFYDNDYRVVQTVTQNHKGGTDRMTAQYHWRGLLMKTYVAHQSPDAQIGNLNITQEYTYDRMGRHLTTTHRIGSGQVKVLVSNSYNALGQLKNKILADGFDEVDYAYNIRGQITKMNDPNDEEEHLFEMAFKYQDATHAKFDGTIGEIEWKNPFETQTNGFDYQYDEMNRISEATGLGEATNYDLSAISYDLNGNIKSLKRKGTHADTTNQMIDDLVYAYNENTNHLMGVTDASDKSTGFNDGNKEGDDYAYDANGNLTMDKNKGITALTYNHLNQPVTVSLSHVEGDSTRTQYTENIYAGAQKIAQVHYIDGVETRRTDYIGGFVYENDTLQFMAHDQGRVVCHPEALEGSDRWEYQYHLTDHLGNIRVTFKTEIDEDTYLATMEDQDTTAIKAYFEKYEEVTRIKSTLFDHTTDSTGYAIHLDGSADRRIGLAKSLMVMPGDTVDMEVFAKYYHNDSSASWTALLNTVAANIAGGASDVVYEAANNASGLPFADFFSGNRSPEGAPKAYLNYLVFDSNYKVDSTRCGFQQISTAAEEKGNNGDHEKLSHQLTFDQPGYVYIYLSNEEDTPMDVFFDDFKVTQKHSPVVQKDDYYPFGLSFNSYTRAAITDQNFKFNAGSELESMTDWYSTPFRKYDPSLGRFHGVDALASMYPSLTPSQFGLNNPIMGNDPTGLKTDPVADARSGNGCGTCYMPELNNGYGFGGWADGIIASARAWMRLEHAKNVAKDSDSGPDITTIDSEGNSSSYEDLDELAADGGGNVLQWNEHGGKEISREEWLALGGDESQSADKYYSGAWEVQTNKGVDNSWDATMQYLTGDGSPQEIGPKTSRSLMNSSRFRNFHNDIVLGRESTSGQFNVNMTDRVFHIGRTNVKYSSNPDNNSITYKLFVNDGFWDPDFIDERYLGGPVNTPDGMGPNLERFGGTPYPYVPRTITIPATIIYAPF